jgi:hypothetical protein
MAGTYLLVINTLISETLGNFFRDWTFAKDN